ncbi:ABC transporter ATP-binding protein [Cellulosilyticum ruminicola]|uniref:ABC transporter ATP-binding protein n=1 Tax=Cellulosilyticum ruminicola TaxID=425254 RepID=UPI0006D2A6BE|nr:ABC transporter ATP-binding protein [Cellulosilyticum ruminicola]
MIDIQGVTKIYKGKKGTEIVANDNINLVVEEGEILGLLGHNGAGKTTLVNQILGLVKPTKGEIKVLDHSIVKNPEMGRFLCSVQPQAQVPIGELTPNQVVAIMGKMRGGSIEEVNKERDRLFEALDIERWAKVEGRHLSGGVKRLTAFCMAVIQSKNVIILDEPTNDVDPVRRRYLWQEIRRLTQEGRSVILVTHNVVEAESAVDKVAILDSGKMIIQGTPSSIKESMTNNLRLEFTTLIPQDQISLPSWIVSSRFEGNRMSLAMEEKNVTRAIEWARSETSNGEITDYSLSEVTLEDVYVKLTEEREGKNHELRKTI